MLRLSRNSIIDALVAAACPFHFMGDKRDTEAPPITLENFSVEMHRYGAMALRARLTRLLYGKLLDELIASDE